VRCMCVVCEFMRGLVVRVLWRSYVCRLANSVLLYMVGWVGGWLGWVGWLVGWLLVVGWSLVGWVLDGWVRGWGVGLGGCFVGCGLVRWIGCNTVHCQHNSGPHHYTH